MYYINDLIGTLTKDAQYRISPKGISFCYWCLAINTHKRGDPNDATIYKDCIAFHEAAEDAGTFKKGQRMSVTGRMELKAPDPSGKRAEQIKVFSLSKPVYVAGEKHPVPAPPDRFDGPADDDDIPF